MAAIPLIRRDPERKKFVYDLNTLAAIFQNPDIHDMEVAVVGVIGSLKSGKSFLLNFIQRFFRNPSDGMVNWMKDGDSQKPLQGFPWNSDSKTSKYILVWNEPFIVEKDNKEKIAVILMEFGGDEAHRQYFHALGFRMCSVLIVNEMSTIPISTLKSIMDKYKFLRGNRTFKLPRIAFLIRDVSETISGQFGNKDGCAFLRQEFQPVALPHELETFLEHVTCALIPVPAFDAIQPASQFDGSYDSLDKTFVKHFGGFIDETLEVHSISFQPAVKGKTGFLQLVSDAIHSVHSGSWRMVYRPRSTVRTESSGNAAACGPSTSHNVNANPEPNPALQQSLGTQIPQEKCMVPGNEIPNIAQENQPKALMKTKVPEHTVNVVTGKRTAPPRSAQSQTSAMTSTVLQNSDLRQDAFFGNMPAGQPAPNVRDGPGFGIGRGRGRGRRISISTETVPGYRECNALLDAALSTAEVSEKQNEKSDISEFKGVQIPDQVSETVTENSPNINFNVETQPAKATENQSLGEKVNDKSAESDSSPPSFAQVAKENAATKEKTEKQKHITVSMNLVLETCLKKFQKILDTETDLEKMRTKHIELVKTAIADFQRLCSAKIKDKNFQTKIDEVAGNLAFELDLKWDSIEKQHQHHCKQVSDRVNTLERTFSESVMSAVKIYSQTLSTPNFQSALKQGKSRVETNLNGPQNFPMKFRADFQKRVRVYLETLSKKANLVHDRALDFKTQMEKKLDMFICMSDHEFKKNIEIQKERAFKTFEYNDSLFESVPELLSQITRYLEQRNTATRSAEAEVAKYAMDYTKHCYNQEMEAFCNKRVHTSEALREFHVKVRDASIVYFNQACNFHADSGIDVTKCVTELRDAMDKLLEPYINSNSVKVMRANCMVAKANTKAKGEYMKIMNEKVNGKSMSEYQLKQCHEEALNAVLVLYRLDIQKIAENCEEEIRTFGENIANNVFVDFRQENDELTKKRMQKEAEELAERERLRQFEEQKCREAEIQRETEEKKRRQESAWRHEQNKRDSFGSPSSAGSMAIGQTTVSSPYNSGRDTGISAIGIEMGLKFIRVGYMDTKNRPSFVKLEDPVEAMPFVVGVANNELVFGTAAENSDQPIRLGDIFTLMRADTTVTFKLNGEDTPFRLEELTAVVLMHVKLKCEEFIGQPITRAVISIPSWFNQELRRATKDAAALAGFVQNRIISEAAAVAVGWWSKHRSDCLKPFGTTKLIVGIASDFSFDVAGIEVDANSVHVKKLVGRMNASLGILTKTWNLMRNLKWSARNELDLDVLVRDAGSNFTFWTGKADQCVFMASPGYEGLLKLDCLSRYCTGNHVSAKTYSLLGAMVLTASGSGLDLKLMETPLYTISWEDSYGYKHMICESSGGLLGGSRKIEFERGVWVSHMKQIAIKIYEKVEHTEMHIGNICIWPPEGMDGYQDVKLTMCISKEGLLSAEAKFGRQMAMAQVSFVTKNLRELDTSKMKIQSILDSMGSAKAFQDAVQNLQAIEQTLRTHINESKKILEILKGPIIHEIDKTMALLNHSSSLVDIEEAVKKLTKYSDKYIKN